MLIKCSVNRTLKQRANDFIEKNKEKLSSIDFRRGIEQAIKDNSDSAYYFQLSTLYDLAELGVARMGMLLRETDLIKSTQRFQQLSNRLIKMFREIFNIPYQKQFRRA